MHDHGIRYGGNVNLILNTQGADYNHWKCEEC